MATLNAGAAVVDISPRDSQFLFGYPHVARYSTGIHDPLLSTALYLSDGLTQAMFIANDIIFVTKAMAGRVRTAIERATGVPGSHIMITATHTHSGPMTVDYASNVDDPFVPPTDQNYLRFFEDCMVAAAIQAHASARPAELGLTTTVVHGLGTNRRDPAGPADPQLPVMMVREAGSRQVIAGMMVYSMHPTVLREDSTLISADFPGMARRYLQDTVLGRDCPLLYHTGPAGNQSPRHVIRENSLAEAKRLGTILGQAAAAVIPTITYSPAIRLCCRQAFIDLPRRALPAVSEAQRALDLAAARLAHLRATGAPRQVVRTAEVDWFGAEETVTLARVAEKGGLEGVYQSCLPAEVQIIRVGPWSFVGWAGEIFVEHALAVKAQCDNTFVISLANGELQGYIATVEAARFGGYEISNALFAPESGDLLVETTLQLLNDLDDGLAASQ